MIALAAIASFTTQMRVGSLEITAALAAVALLAAAQAATAAGQVSPNGQGDPNLNQLSWQVPDATTHYFPAVRVDFNASEKYRFNVA